MFERFFRPSTPEGCEQRMRKIVRQVFKNGVNKWTMRDAFDIAQQKNASEKLGLNDNQLLNIVREEAMGATNVIDDAMYGGVEQTEKLITEECQAMYTEMMERKHNRIQTDPQSE